MPRSELRVVCALWVTIATLDPTSALTSVDLPALGAPRTATKPQRRVASPPSTSVLLRSWKSLAPVITARCSPMSPRSGGHYACGSGTLSPTGAATSSWRRTTLSRSVQHGGSASCRPSRIAGIAGKDDEPVCRNGDEGRVRESVPACTIREDLAAVADSRRIDPIVVDVAVEHFEPAAAKRKS